MEHEEQAEAMERDADEMAERSERVGEHIDEARSEWAAKEQDSAVPGAQPDPEEDEPRADEPDDPSDRETAVMETPKESDQLPEEAPAEQVPDDTGDDARPEADESPGVPGEEGTATGNPDAAGADR